jgi:hypothetical protein
VHQGWAGWQPKAVLESQPSRHESQPSRAASRRLGRKANLEKKAPKKFQVFFLGPHGVQEHDHLCGQLLQVSPSPIAIAVSASIVSSLTLLRIGELMRLLQLAAERALRTSTHRRKRTRTQKTRCASGGDGTAAAAEPLRPVRAKAAATTRDPGAMHGDLHDRKRF